MARGDSTDSPPRLSWDSERDGAPARPKFTTSLPEKMFVARPRRVMVAWVLVLAGTIGTLYGIASAAFHVEALRDAMLAALPEDLTEEYDASDIQRGADVILAAIGALSLIFVLGQMLSISTLTFRRSTAARVVFILLTVLSVPVTLLAFIVREGSTADIALSATIVFGMFTTAVIICTTLVSTWLRQSEERRTIPLLAPDRRLDARQDIG